MQWLLFDAWTTLSGIKNKSSLPKECLWFSFNGDKLYSWYIFDFLMKLRQVRKQLFSLFRPTEAHQQFSGFTLSSIVDVYTMQNLPEKYFQFSEGGGNEMEKKNDLFFFPPLRKAITILRIPISCICGLLWFTTREDKRSGEKQIFYLFFASPEAS